MRRLISTALVAIAALLVTVPGDALAGDEPAPGVVAEAPADDNEADAAMPDADEEEELDDEELANEDFMELVRAMRTFPTPEDHPGDEAAFKTAANARAAEVAALARDFAFAYPEHQMTGVAVDLFFRMVENTGKSDGEMDEMKQAFVADARGTPLDVTISLREAMEGMEPETDAAPFVARLRELLARNPGDLRILSTLAELAMHGTLEKEARLELLDELAAEEELDPVLLAALAGTKRMIEAVGRPVSFAFTSIDGRAIDTTSMKGKVVLVDFWATWCGPCVAEMPRLKQTYATYHDQGFEIVGISLDQSREDLVSYVEEEKIAWPQSFHEGEEGHPEATKWGIVAIPTMFLIDKAGILRSVEARREMDTLIPALLGE